MSRESELEKQAREQYPWALETMLLINKLTPDIKGKAFDPDWFLLRQRLEEMERQAAQVRAQTIEECLDLTWTYATASMTELRDRIRALASPAKSEEGKS